MSRRRPTASEALGAALAELGEDPHPEDVLEAVESYYDGIGDEAQEACDSQSAEDAYNDGLLVLGCINALRARREARRVAIEIRSDEGPYLLRQVSR